MVGTYKLTIRARGEGEIYYWAAAGQMQFVTRCGNESGTIIEAAGPNGVDQEVIAKDHGKVGTFFKLN